MDESSVAISVGGRTEARGEGDLDPSRTSESFFILDLTSGGFWGRGLWKDSERLGVRVPVPVLEAGRRVAGGAGESSESAKPSLSIAISIGGSGAAVSAITEAVGSLLAPLSCLTSSSRDISEGESVKLKTLQIAGYF